MKEKAIYKIYCHTNLINGKKYVGITSQSLIKRFRTDGSGYKKCKYFWKAIQKYGWNNFKHELIFQNLTQEQAEMFEIALIKYYKTTNKKYGYNISNGGKVPSNVRCSHKKIICIETREVFNSALELSEKINVKINKVYRACNNIAYKLFNFHYCYVDNFSDNYISNLQKAKSKKEKAIICLETKEIFNSIMECSKKMKIIASNISEVCNKNRITASGFHFLFLNEYDSNTEYDLRKPDKKNNCKKVICIYDNKIFNSITECANYYNIDISLISAICKGKRKTTKGLSFKYYE